MSFWKKLYKKLKKIQKTDPDQLEQDKYFKKLQQQLKKHKWEKFVLTVMKEKT